MSTFRGGGLPKKANELKTGWKPGKQRGKTVRVSFTLPVKFGIQK